MDSPSSSFHYWNNLPNEIKLRIIQKADNNSRLALKACSLNNYQLIASMPSRSIYRMCLWNDRSGKWHINIARTIYGCEESLIFDTPEEFQNKVKEEIDNSDYIEILELAREETSNQLRFTKSGELLKVGGLIFRDYNRDILEILNRIDPCHLKHLQLYQDNIHRDVFETPLVKQVHHLHVEYSYVTDDQLLNIENPELSFRDPENVTLVGINQYIKKCLLNLNIKPVSFEFAFFDPFENIEELFQGLEIQMSTDVPELSRYARRVVEVGSNLSNYQLEIECENGYIKGKTICRNQHPLSHHTSEYHQNSYKSVNSVTIEPGRFTIAEKNVAPVTYIFDSDNDLQTKLTEEMNKIDYIKHLELKETEVNWQLCLPNKQVTVGKLFVDCESFDSDFLKQIEPTHLKEISIHVASDDGKIYSMPQFIHAQKLDISNCCIRDEDLMSTNAIQVILNRGQHKTLIDPGINKFIKKIVSNLNLHDYNFEIHHSGNEENASGRLEGLDIFSNDRLNRIFTRIIVNSPFPKFKLELLDRPGMIIGQRITAEDAEKPPQIDDDDSSDDDYDYDYDGNLVDDGEDHDMY